MSQIPGLSTPLVNAMQTLLRGGEPDQNVIFHRKDILFDRLNIPTGGVTNLAFFQQAQSKWYRNVNSGQLPADTIFIAQAIRLTPEFNVTYADGTRLGTTARTALGDTAVNVGPLTQAEEARTILQGGMLTFKIGDRNWVDGIYGLSNFPSGPVPTLEGFAATTNNNATTINERIAALIVNGNADVNAKWGLGAIPILPNKSFSINVDWQAQLTVTAPLVLRMEIEGIRVTAANG